MTRCHSRTCQPTPVACKPRIPLPLIFIYYSMSFPISKNLNCLYSLSYRYNSLKPTNEPQKQVPSFAHPTLHSYLRADSDFRPLTFVHLGFTSDSLSVHSPFTLKPLLPTSLYNLSTLHSQPSTVNFLLPIIYEKSPSFHP